MTPTTITVIAWNYCQNRCRYCVSQSNTDQWKLNGKTKVWKPKGDSKLNFYELCEKYGFGFHERMCPQPDKYLNAKDVVDFDYVIKWVKKYRPNSHIHISGGEPLLRPDIEKQVAKVCKEFPTTIVTNGQLISERPKLLDLPVKWLVTYHIGQIKLDELIPQLELIKDKPHLITTIIDVKNGYEINQDIADKLKDYNFEFKYNDRPSLDKNFVYDKEDLKDIASNRIMIIQPNGPVEGCNKPHRGPWDRYKSHSNIYTMQCDEKALAINNERAINCIKNNRCGAYQTAVKMAKIG